MICNQSINLNNWTLKFFKKFGIRFRELRKGNATIKDS